MRESNSTTQEQKTMGNWSSYSEGWEKQHAKKVIENANAARIEFEKKP